jgi:transposase
VAELERVSGRRDAALDHSRWTIPGVGAATAPAIDAEIGDSQRFTDSDQLVALVGVEPPRHASG